MGITTFLRKWITLKILYRFIKHGSLKCTLSHYLSPIHLGNFAMGLFLCIEITVLFRLLQPYLDIYGCFRISRKYIEKINMNLDYWVNQYNISSYESKLYFMATYLQMCETHSCIIWIISFLPIELNSDTKREGEMFLLKLLWYKFHQDGKLTYLPANQDSLGFWERHETQLAQQLK